MNYQTTRKALQGVAFTTAIPFTDNSEKNIKYEDYKNNLQAIEDAGGQLYIPCGNTGEYYSLTHDERVNVSSSTVEAVSTDSVVIAGVAGSTKTVKKLSEEYNSLGVDGIMIMHPDHTYLHETGIEQYYRNIAKATDLPVVLYKRGPEISNKVVTKLAGVENIIGIKYAVNDIEGFSKIVESVPNDFVCVNGIAERFAPAFALEGAEGFTTGIGNFVPELPLKLHSALSNNNFEQARRIRNLARPYETLRAESGDNNRISAANNIPAVKYGMDLAGLEGGPVREPLVNLSGSDRQRAEKYYSEIMDSTIPIE
ncbi:dihydrodipicolinate synthase family protein [Halalkalicoccus tibetensis]|uniref:Dihydrodipicolinate synthase family protein n=1 Tax=Halalkalicoccus tibetensis TaxID=175632 RepID=A0ABD5V6H2_9EURY